MIHSRTTKHEIQVQAKKARYDAEFRQKNKSTKQLEEERRVDGLSQAISSDNKGFAMLAKMGYKQGDAIGKSSGNSSSAATDVKRGIVEPIGIQIKSDRGGLGREAALKQLSEKRAEIRRQRLLGANKDGQKISTEEYRRRQTQKAEEKQMESNLGKCQRACEKLDSTVGTICEPAMVWFWPQRKKVGEDTEETSDKEESEDEAELEEYEVILFLISLLSSFTNLVTFILQTAEKLEMLTNYLRTTYCFCHWCGTHYNDSTDMNENCPGPTKDDH